MSAAKEITQPAEKIGIIAGGGTLPKAVAAACTAQNIPPFIVAFKDQTDPQTVQGTDHVWSRIGAAGSIIKTLKAKEIKDLIIIGSMGRPKLTTLRPDLKTAAFFAKNSLKKMGDNNLLSALRRFLEEEGFTIHGAQKFVPELLTPTGTLGKIEPTGTDKTTITLGIKESQTLGRLDKGQAVIVRHDGQESRVLGKEDASGTDALIKRSNPGGILVKTCKPQQDLDLDLPTIGFQTIQNAIDSGLRGIVLHAGASFFLEREESIKRADKAGIFIIGAEIP